MSGYYVHQDVLHFFHQFKLAPPGSSKEFIEREKHEIAKNFQEFRECYQKTGYVSHRQEYLRTSSRDKVFYKSTKKTKKK